MEDVLQRNSAPSLTGKVMSPGATERKQSEGDESIVMVQRQLPYPLSQVNSQDTVNQAVGRGESWSRPKG